MAPFSTDPESFGQRFISRPSFRYMMVAEFDDITENPTPLSNIIGPDTEVLYIEAQDLKRPQNAPKRTYLTGDTSPVGKWARWVQSWRDHGREFDGAHPESHDGEYMWLSLKQVAMGKRGTHEVWLYDGVPSPDEIAAVSSVSQSAPAGRPVSTPVLPPTTEQPAGAIAQDTLQEAILLVCADGISPLMLFSSVNEMVMAEVPKAEVMAARDLLLKGSSLRTESGKLFSTRK